MQQNLNHIYPQMFYMDGGTENTPRPCIYSIPTAYSLPPPIVRRKKKTRDCSPVFNTSVFILVLLALAGVGVGIFFILKLQWELNQLKEVVPTATLMPAVEKHIGLPSVSEQKKEPKKAAHLTGYAGKNVNTGSKTLMWEHVFGLAFTSGIEYKGGGLFINETGLYFIYSKVYFRAQDCKGGHLSLSHIVFKRTPRYSRDITLMETKKLNFCSNTGMWTRSTYLGGIFNLTRMDSVYVNVSDLSLVSSDETKTFFGLYKI
ncbi:tumor necrosis factor ligand superfamily member 6 [Latimeria chalumnae]|nr:PREDICTED: tumor necrosis factor ligand superfamily member 6 [Latimeria chalumnae]|eukprot:XP_014345429.1 PREDICTED: tumor necrosis factor ligand superfamily member 6 [Latimeria chalumnae]